jgi:hypothetical protein
MKKERIIQYTRTPSGFIYLILMTTNMRQDIVVGTATGYGLDNRGVGVRVPVG